MRFSQLVFVEFGTLLYIFFIISKSLHYSVEFGKFAFMGSLFGWFPSPVMIGDPGPPRMVGWTRLS